MAKKCTLCGGKLDSTKRCTLCGLDNTKNDEQYQGYLNRNNHANQCNPNHKEYVHSKNNK